MMKEYAKVIDKLVKEVATFKRKNNIRGIVKIFNDEATLLNKNIEVYKYLNDIVKRTCVE